MFVFAFIFSFQGKIIKNSKQSKRQKKLCHQRTSESNSYHYHFIADVVAFAQTQTRTRRIDNTTDTFHLLLLILFAATFLLTFSFFFCNSSIRCLIMLQYLGFSWFDDDDDDSGDNNFIQASEKMLRGQLFEKCV